MNDSEVVQTSIIQQRLAEFITRTRLSAIPPEFVTRLKWSLLDSLGCGLQGSETPWGRIVAKFAHSQGKGPCRVWGGAGNARTSAMAAVLANGTMIQSFEIDDVHYGSRSHPGSVTIPVAMAILETTAGLSGRKLLEGVAVGYELLARVGACQGISSFNRGWHPTGTAGAFAAAATASCLLGLSSKACIHALGIAGTMPAGLMAAQYGAMVKRLFAGHAAWAGLSAALLAKGGFTGIENIFDSEYGGYPKALSDQISVPALTDNLGAKFEAASIAYKLFACVGTNHTTLGAISDLIHQHKFAWNDVEEICVLTSEYQVLHSGWDYKPGTVIGAQMNMQYCVAVLLIHGQVFIDQFEKKYLTDPKILSLARRVRITANPKQDHNDRTATVDVHLKDGRRLQASCSAAKGHSMNPPSQQDIEDKFMALAGKVLPVRRCRRIVEIVFSLERVKDLSGFSSLLARAAR